MKLWDSPLRNLPSAAVLAGALAVAAFLNAPANEFAFDDNFVILGNTGIHYLETLPQALGEPYWPGMYGEGRALWRPVVTGLFGLEWWAFDGDPAGFHVVNVLVHAFATALVVLLLGEFIPVAGALVGGLFFAVHPVHVEAVSNIVGMSELLSSFFFLLACLLVARSRERMGPGRVSGVLGLFLLAFLTKESAVTLPGVILLLDSSKEDLRLRDLGSYLANRWPLYGGMAAVAGVVLIGRAHVLGGLGSPFPPLGASLLTEIPRIWTVAGTWSHILRLLVFPMDLSADYQPAVIPLAFGWSSGNIAGAFLALSVLGLAFFSWGTGVLDPKRIRPRALGWGVTWGVITLSTTSNLFFLSGILLSERTLYLPSVGFAMAAGWLFLRLGEVRPRLAPVLVVVALALLSVRTWVRTPTWKNNTEVFQALIDDHPEAGRSQWVLGDSYFAIGQYRPGMQAYRAAIGTLRGHYSVSVGVARQLMAIGHDRPAEVLLRNAWDERPDFGVAPGLLAQIYLRQERPRDAEAAARFSLDKDDSDPTQHWILGWALQAQARWPEAEASVREALRRAETGQAGYWRGLAEIQLQSGDTASARVSLDSARAWADSPAERRQLDSLWVGSGIGSM